MSDNKSDKVFHPPWWLRNRHLQSCYSLIFSPKFTDHHWWEQLDLPDGDFVDLFWTGRLDSVAKPIVVLLHGLEGSYQSHYIQVMLEALTRIGWRAVVMHFRGCSGRLNRLPRIYHASHTQDFEFLLQILVQRFPSQPLFAVGFSLGGNVLLNHLIQRVNSPLQSAVAVSVPFELSKCADFVSPFYEWSLLRSMKNKMIQKILAGQQLPVSVPEIKKIFNFRGFDTLLTAPINGFRDVEDYYRKSSVRYRLHEIKHPTLIIHAKDDPFVPNIAIPEKSEFPKDVTLDLYDQGGHVGFIHGSSPWHLERWFQNRILDFLQKSV